MVLAISSSQLNRVCLAVLIVIVVVVVVVGGGGDGGEWHEII